MGLVLNLWWDMTPVFPPPSAFPSIDMVTKIIDAVPMDVALIAPSLLEEMSESEETMKRLEKVPWVMYGGGKKRSLAGPCN